ncbi:hypothetical protein [Streptomyces avermitilis]|uniref:hypothetical protein n=1 Tax=Streptomyces avermitilis TaxID=33903 RepID=UPI0037F97A32
MDLVVLQQPGPDQLTEPEPGAVELIVAAGAGRCHRLEFAAQRRGGVRGVVPRAALPGGAGKPDPAGRAGGRVAVAQSDAVQLQRGRRTGLSWWLAIR